jgi:hypothetical protein
MKKTIYLFAAFLLSASVAKAQAPRKVQVAILFDTSNSMDGLIDQAKSRIWNIVNEISTLSYNGFRPSVEIALYHYGNDNLSPGNHYIEQMLALTGDLDAVSQKLFGLRTNGGSEFCGAVIGRSLTDLNWSTNPADLKMIYIAGNEAFNQGPIDYKEECKRAATRGIFINTIYCGNYDQGVREFWKDGATCSNGDYFNIDSDKKIAHIKTPYDEQINQYNDSLNKTYYGYGAEGERKKTMQISEDHNAETTSMSVKAERSIAKSKGNVYNNSSWDIVDAVDKDGKDIGKMEEKDLPEEFKGKTTEEREAMLKEIREDRANYQGKIGELAKNRQQFIDEELKKQAAEGAEVDDFGTSVNESIIKKAEKIGYKKEN